MGGAADEERASSPLKRRASTMDPEANPDENVDENEDVDMVTAPAPAASVPGQDGATEAEAEAEDHTMTESPGSSANKDGAAPVADDTAARPPESVEAHIKTIIALCEEMAARNYEDGERAFIVSKKWVRSVVGDATDSKSAQKWELDAKSIGPVDNSDIIWEVIENATPDGDGDPLDKYFVRLKSGTDAIDHFDIFPPAAWDLLMQWPGLMPDQKPIVRTAHKTTDNADSNVMLEYHPPVFTVHRLWSPNSPKPITQMLKAKPHPPLKIAKSRASTYKAFLSQAKDGTRIEHKEKVRVWRIPQKLAAGPATNGAAPTPPASPGQLPDTDGSQDSWSQLLVEIRAFEAVEEKDRVDFQDVTVDPKYNGHANLELVGLTTDQSIVLDEHILGNRYVSNYSPSSEDNETHSANRSSSASLAVSRNTRSGRTSPAPSGPLTRGRAGKSGKPLGCVGLGNLGNTCYMNAALQCVRSVEELTKYFLSDVWKAEINADNVLSHNGEVAAAYAHLLRDVYADASRSSVQPRHFKSVIGKYAPAFSGWGQQDSQEFLGFLLDGLQEDLSRIRKKPYIEKPDSTDEMISNPAAIREMAEKVWDITKKRDDSVIADLFTGLYKSTLVCPNCGKVSITFDPFNNLTLPLPVENKWSHSIKFAPLNDRPVEMEVELDKSASIRKLKEFVSSRTGVPVERLHGAEQWRGAFYKQYSNGAGASEEISGQDHAWIYELETAPTNWNSSESQKVKGPRSMISMLDEVESPNHEVYNKMLVPVIHRRRDHMDRYRSVLVPHFIILDPEEARSEDAIRRKILQKVATFTTETADFRDESDASDVTEPEIVGSESGSSNEGKFVAHSVEGEDDIVDVSAEHAAGDAASNRQLSKARSPIYSSNRPTPSWVDPKVFLNPDVQNLFELGYFVESGPLVPTGKDSTERDLPRLSSRVPEPAVSDDGAPESANVSNESDSDGQSRNGMDKTSSATDEPVTRMADESDEETPKVPFRFKQGKATHKVAGSRKKLKGYGKKGKKGTKSWQAAQSASKKQAKEERKHPAPPPRTSPEVGDTGADGGPLIRLREGIVVDWNDDAYEKYFGNSQQTTWDNCTMLQDPELVKTRKIRENRRKNGISLDNCLDEFEREEVLSEQDTWYCPRCKEHQRATKKFDLWKTPDILIVHLKRFSSSGYRRDKLEAKVDFPLEGLNLTERVLGKDEKEEIYDLIAVDCHWGGLGGGHYTAHAKNFVDDTWYSYNDSSVSKTSLDQIVDSSAYLLFYRRRSDRVLGGPLFEKIVENSGEPASEDETGEGQRLGEGSSRPGSPSALQGQEPGHILPHQAATRGGSNERDDDDDDVLAKNGIQRGIIETDRTRARGINMTQEWNFHKISMHELTPEADDEDEGFATDEAQHDSEGEGDSGGSGEDPFLSPDKDMSFDRDTEMDVPGTGHYDLNNPSSAEPPPYQSGIPPPEYRGEMTREEVWAGNKQKIVNVPAQGEDQRSEEAAEIHLDEEEKS